MNREENRDHFARHGGVHFSARVPAEEINRFVGELPAENRESLYEVLRALNENGLITIHNDGLWVDEEGRPGGSDEC